MSVQMADEKPPSKIFNLLLSNSGGLTDAAEILRISKLLEYSFTVGFMLGGFTSGRSAMLQFMAEHQHLLPLKRRSDYVLFIRNRNYRVMAAFGSGGLKRGLQMSGVCAIYSAVRIGTGMARTGTRLIEGGGEWIDDIVGGMAAGATFAYAGKGHRLYYLRKGVVFGGLMGASLAALRYLNSLKLGLSPEIKG